jgi:glycosyltransferase involved in cell wall biosynthesis
VPKVSILIPCYNAARFVGRTLDSLLRQTFQDWECIVVDDGSTDDSAAVVREYTRTESRIRLIRQANAGVCRARNTGYAACPASTTYLLFLDADDCPEPRMLDLLVDYLDAHGEVGLAYCAFGCIDDDDRPTAWEMVATRYAASRFGVRALSPEEPDTPFAAIFCAWCGILPSGALLRRSVYATTPGWDEVLGQGAEDTDLFLHMALRGKVHFLPRQLLRHRRHATQSSRDEAKHVAKGRELREKWAAGDQLTPAQQEVVRQAQRFRSSRVLPYYWASFGRAHLKSGNLVEGVKCHARAAKQAISGLLVA